MLLWFDHHRCCGSRCMVCMAMAPQGCEGEDGVDKRGGTGGGWKAWTDNFVHVRVDGMAILGRVASASICCLGSFIASRLHCPDTASYRSRSAPPLPACTSHCLLSLRSYFSLSSTIPEGKSFITLSAHPDLRSPLLPHCFFVSVPQPTTSPGRWSPQDPSKWTAGRTGSSQTAATEYQPGP